MTRRRTLSPETVKFKPVDFGKPKGDQLRGALVVLQGSESDIGTHVWLDQPVTLGRDPKVELPLQDHQISRRHCRISSQGDVGFVLEDLNSTNGTKLNGEPVKGRRQLSPGDRIFLGACVVKFTVSDDLEDSYHEQMDRLVGTDDLTGLQARRRFEAAYQRAFEAARNTRTPLSLLMLDLDGLKRINDTHGHPVGEQAIASAGKIIGESVVDGGAACRLGGDEFIVLLPAMPKPAAIECAEAIRKRVADEKFEFSGVTVQSTISIGVATFPVDAKQSEPLKRRADEALYRAKKAGGNQVAS